MTLKNWLHQRAYAKHLHELQGVTRWRRVALIVFCVLSDVGMLVWMFVGFDRRDGSEWSDTSMNYAAIAGIVTVASWFLLPLALRHVPREYSPYENYPGPLISLVSAVMICATAGLHQLAVSVYVVYISLVSRGNVRWGVAGLVAMTASLGVKVYDPDAFETIPMSVFGYGLLWCVFVLSGFLIGVARHNRREKQSILVAQAELNEEKLQAGTEKARQEERERIARDMHDSLSHRLSLISVFAGGLAYRDDLSREQVAESAATIQSEAEHAVDDLRRVLHSLRFDDRIDPRTSLEDHVARARATGTKVAVNYVDDCTGELSTMGVHALSRAVQEGLTNARKYAPGHKVHIEVDREDDMARVTMRNRKAEKVLATGGGNGLMGMRERARLAGGRLDVHDDEEFSWSLYLPLEER
ncbi:sensor histidine kinase [Corynebacterium phoceense]|uniref:sensor histidine kinase n=1 Tax=Corynebacterium phoceense TaxID=1686286 RepID=UPI001E61EA7A|nr:histidine kinase [Corynebacterium phoceense]